MLEQPTPRIPKHSPRRHRPRVGNTFHTGMRLRIGNAKQMCPHVCADLQGVPICPRECYGFWVRAALPACVDEDSRLTATVVAGQLWCNDGACCPRPLGIYARVRGDIACVCPVCDRFGAQRLVATVFATVASSWLGALLTDAVGWGASSASLTEIFPVAGILVMRENRSFCTGEAGSRGRPRAIERLTMSRARTVRLVAFTKVRVCSAPCPSCRIIYARVSTCGCREQGDIATLYGIGCRLYYRFARRLGSPAQPVGTELQPPFGYTTLQLDNRYGRASVLLRQQFGSREKAGSQWPLPRDIEMRGYPKQRQYEDNLAVVIENRRADAVDVWDRHPFTPRESAFSNVRQNGIKLCSCKAFAFRSLRPHVRLHQFIQLGRLFVRGEYPAGRGMYERHDRTHVNTSVQGNCRLNTLEDGRATVSPRGEQHTLLETRRELDGWLHRVSDCRHHAQGMQPHPKRQRAGLETQGDRVTFDQTGAKQAHHVWKHLVRRDAASCAQFRKCHWLTGIREILQEAAADFHALNAPLFLSSIRIVTFRIFFCLLLRYHAILCARTHHD